MGKIKIKLPDGSEKEYEKGVTGHDVAKSIGERLAGAALAVEIDGKVQDLMRKIEHDCSLRILTSKDPEGKKVMWHTSEHILTEAMLKLYPDIVMAMGPATDEGFYFDFDSERTFSPEDFPAIEKEIDEIIKRDVKIRREEIPIKEARKLFKGNKYKEEWLDEIENNKEPASVYWTGDEFVDLCSGPHLPSTGKAGVVKLVKVAGAYWRGDSKNKMLQRIYGVSFLDKKELAQYLHVLEEAAKRDHRKLGKELDLFSFQLEAPGMPFFHNKGTIVFNELVSFMTEEMRKLNYQIIKTPMILNKSLWHQSGHWDHYKDNMYFTKIDNDDFAVKPMNCPGGMLVYKSSVHSYRDLPIKAGEFGMVHRHELSGVLSGLFRVRVFTQDDAHVFCTEDQIKGQIIELINLVDRIYSKFGLSYAVELSTKPEKSMGSVEIWKLAEDALEDALKAKNMKYKINPGDGAFYGPKIDYHVKDCLGRTWQCGTIQLDFSMPERFDLTYEGSDGKKHRPVMLHRAIYGSVERFIGILTEHFAGKFPLWLAPVQVRILTVSQKYETEAEALKKKIFDAGIRVEVDNRTESIPKKVREAQLNKVPLMITLGEKEIESDTVALRTLDGEVKYGLKVDDFIATAKKNINERNLIMKF